MNEKGPRTYSDEEELEELKQLADALGLKLGKLTHSGSDANLVGLRDEHLLVSRRLDSRTYFVHDARYGMGKKAGVHSGEEEHLAAVRRILTALQIPDSEIGDEKVVTEQTQVAQVDTDRNVLNEEPAQAGRRLAFVSRQIDGLPVWSSTVTLGLTADGVIGYLQLHWPELPQPVVREAHRLAHKVSGGWEAPRHSGTDVEKVEAGIVHSPAVGLCMDLCPAIRVIYGPGDERLRKKVVLHYDRHGKLIALPRQASLPFEESLQRSAP